MADAVNKWEIIGDKVIMFGLRAMIFVLILVLGFKLVKFINKKLRKKKSWVKMDPTLRTFVYSVTSGLLKLGVIAVAVVASGIETSSFFAVVGAAGVAIGLALQGSLSNLAAGVLIITNRPFRIGDYIDTAGTSGTVTEIGLFYTYLTTPDNKAVIIPNSSVTTSVITNYGIYTTRRLDFDFGVSYDSDTITVKRVLMEVANENKLILKDPEPFVAMTTHADSYVGYKLRVWVKAADYWDLYFEMHEAVKTAFDREGIDIPFPQLVLHKPVDI